MKIKPSFNDTFSKAHPGESETAMFRIDESSVLFLNEAKMRPENAGQMIERYRRWFWNAVNRGNRQVLFALEEIAQAWSKNHRLCFACDHPKHASYHDVLIEFLSWTFWRNKVIDGYIFTSQIAKR